VPNPFNPTTRISFVVPHRASIRLDIYDVGGRHVRTLIDRSMDPGAHAVDWDGKNALGNNVRSGVYFYRLQAGNQATTRKLAIIR